MKVCYYSFVDEYTLPRQYYFVASRVFVIGLQQARRLLGLSATGFVVLDSPLVTFREADVTEVGLDLGSGRR